MNLTEETPEVNQTPSGSDPSKTRGSRLNKWLPLIAAALIALGMVLGYLLADNRRPAGAEGKLAEILDIIRDEYVDEVNLDSVLEMTLPLMLHNLDPHSSYISKADLEEANSELEGSFCGIGIRFMVISDTIMISEVFADGPAQRGGLMAGDRIIKVDGRDITVEGISDTDVPKLLRGPRESEVKLTIMRPGRENTFEKTLVRGDIPVSSIDAAFMVNDTIGYVKVNKFSKNTYQEFLQSMMELTLKGAESFILDLRGNRGGLFEGAVLMANEFLPGGVNIVETRGRNSSDNSIIISDGRGIYTGAPLTVLIDEYSASSSEIFAAAIQDNDRGLIVGRRSFGKGLVQKPITLADSSEIRLTVQRYYTPSGRSIQKKYQPGHNFDYEAEIIDRYNNGEIFGKEDSTRNADNEIYLTAGGREVHGGGGVTPDVAVPADTLGMSGYYLEVAEKGLIQRYAFEIADLNRVEFSKCKNVDELMAKLPSNSTLVRSFAQYAAQNGVAARWYYINKSSLRIVNSLKAWIANDILGQSAFYEVLSLEDPTYLKAVELARHGVKPLIPQE